MAIATSALIEQFSSNVDSLKVAGTIYPLVGATLMLVAGVLGLYVGWRRLLIGGLCFGLVSSISKIYAPSIEWITYVSRSLSGLAGVAIIPSTMALVVNHFSINKRASIFGLLAGSTGLAAAVIPLISGYLIDTLAWNVGFYATSISYGIAIFCAIAWIPTLRIEKPLKFDLGGSLLSAIAMFFLILGLLKSPEWGFISNHSPYQLIGFLDNFSPALWMLLVGTLFLALFILYELVYEQKHNSSLIPTAWLLNNQFLLGISVLVIMYIIFGGLNFTLVAFLQVAISMSAVQTGAIILVFALSLIVFSVLTPTFFVDYDHKFIALGGFAMCGIGSAVLWLCTTATSVGYAIYIAMLVFGAGLGMLSSQAAMIITNAVPENQAQRTGGIQATLRNVGLAIGIAVIAGLGQAAMEDKVRKTVSNNTDYSVQIQRLVSESTSIPYITDEQLLVYLSNQNVAAMETIPLLTLNAESRRTNFHVSVFLIGLFSILGGIVCCRLEKQNDNLT